MKNVNGFLPIALVVGDVRGYCVLSNHCHIQILDVSHDLLNGFDYFLALEYSDSGSWYPFSLGSNVELQICFALSVRGEWQI